MIKSWLLRGLALLVLAWMSYDLIFSDHGYLIYRAEQQQVQDLQVQLETLKQQREKLAQDILRLRHDPKALEDLVHRDLGYLYPDEFMMIMPDEKAGKGAQKDE
ncbi:MAG: septum formation initiator family protein [Mariprofundaceae bacterium]|nr:septum formation initiator family protein [Mariprofundaceae bacterium]MBL4760044.1 septum formation initiator family protein [Mariprofundaceae bacterium]